MLPKRKFNFSSLFPWKQVLFNISSILTHIHFFSQIKESIRDCFVTGKWKASEDASELLRLDDLTDEDEELYDDFEDLETGEKHTVESAKKPSKDDDETELDDSKEPEEPMTKEKLMEKKRKLKEKFDAEYDDKTGEGSSYYDDLKQEASKQAELNKSMFEGLEDEVRVELEGFRSGMYVRMELTQMSCELVTNFDPTYPLIVGGLQSGEETIGYVNVSRQIFVHKVTRLGLVQWQSRGNIYQKIVHMLRE